MPREKPEEQRPGTSGVAAGTAAAGTATAGTAAPAPVTAGVGAVGIAQTTAAVLAALRAFWGGEDDFIWLYQSLLRRHPELQPDELKKLADRESAYGQEFRRRMAQRMERDVPRALATAEPKRALRKVLEREKRYTRQRQQAMLARSISTIERDSIKRISPLGAYWRLSPFVKEHTIDCIAMGGKFWPWEVLDVIHPPRHAGCPCELYGLEEAIQRGFLPFGFKPPHPADGIELARELQARFKELREALRPGEDLAELIDELESIRLQEAPWAKRFAKGTEKGGEFMPRRGGFSARLRSELAKSVDGLLRVGSGRGRARPQRAPIEPKPPGGHTPESYRRAWEKSEKVAEKLRAMPGGKGPRKAEGPPVAGEAGSPPKNFGEFSARVSSGAAKAAEANHAKLVFKGLEHDPEEPDTTALRWWDGHAAIGEDAPAHLEGGAAAQAGESDPKAASGVWLTYSRGAHESVGHGVNPITSSEYATPEGYALEEALAEEIGRDEARAWLAEDGHTDAIAWADANPDHPRALGAYSIERARLATLLDAALVAPADRRDLLRTMSLRQGHQARLNTLSALLANAAGLEPSAAAEMVRQRLAGEHDSELGLYDGVGAEAHLPVFQPAVDLPDEGGSKSSPEKPSEGATGASGGGSTTTPPTTLVDVSGPRGFDARHYSDPRRSLLAKMRALPEGKTIEMADGTKVKRGPKGSFRVTPPGGEQGKLYSTPQRAVNAETAGILERHGVGGAKLKAARGFAGAKKDAQRAPAEGDKEVRDGNPQFAGAAGVKTGPKEEVPRPENPGIPTYKEADLHLHDFKAAGGSNGAQFATDAAGSKWLVKAYRGNTDRVATELLANAVYRELGIEVPEAGKLGSGPDFSAIADEPLDEPPLPDLPPLPLSAGDNTAEGELTKGKFDAAISALKGKGKDKGKTPRKEQSTGLLVLEDDGSVWLFEPKGGFGGYQNTFSKGRLEKGLSPQQNARKELWEELGMRANPVAYLGDYEGDETMTRFYVARRTSEPVDPPGGETEPGGVKKVSAADALELLNKSRDRDILLDVVNGEWPAGDRTDHEPPEGPPQLAYPLVDGKTERWKGASQELGEGFMADALLGNWDVVGLQQDNVLWTADGRPVRVDQGGTFEFRAMGKEKPFGPVPTEVWTMRSPKGQAFGRMALSEEMMRDQARDISERLTPQRIDELIDQTPFADEEMRDRVRGNLKARVTFMRGIAEGTEELPGPLRGEEADLQLEQDLAHLEPLYPEEERAISHLLEDGEDIDNHLRSGAPKQAASLEVQGSVEQLDALLGQARAGEDFNAYVPIAFETLGADGDALAGKRFKEASYLTASTDETSARAAGKAVLRLLVPEGTRVLSTSAAGLSTEPGAVLFKRGTQVRIAGAAMEDGVAYVDAVVG
jgi:hypothetical protein